MYQVYQAQSSGSTSQVAAVSRTNIWAVARTFTTAGKAIYRPFIRHFNGRSWQAVTIPHAAAFTADWVSASAADNVWLGGLASGRFTTSAVYRWNGTRWRKIRLPAGTFLAGVVAIAPDNVWASGSSSSVFADIFHWNGSRWQHYLPGATNFFPQAISASGPGNVWVSGFRYISKKQVVAAYRWHGGAWHPVRMPHPVLNNGGPAVTAVSAAGDLFLGLGERAVGDHHIASVPAPHGGSRFRRSQPFAAHQDTARSHLGLERDERRVPPRPLFIADPGALIVTDQQGITHDASGSRA